ncbi:MAG TPA: metalloregulator ArsR/SmtB family transcription factor [Myxococcota bacterium]|nr:metalloregulator ArsR/SmtB family transcription factor [Myxococcota bacterium]HOA13070.1 metalloregulator ArsR/SmtB family transcription factor [Myxococcota bacterium]HOC99854.1 metalloregulator ArsR/SmtB family transcription factor [Myxococcota bacterium]HOH76072.1 metalloregulator ArsR/SmtB family transcription factor [Myxococcota bacterium]HPV03898.1 metalloregulator ArsR/SmtB family transcription factor [Myxococcota bacterium]
MKDQDRQWMSVALAGVLSNRMRMSIVSHLQNGPCTVLKLCEAVGLSQAVVSKQLGILRDSGLLICRPQGRVREYALQDPYGIARLLEAMDGAAQVASKNALNCRKMDESSSN